jgi:hypothetical protein
MNCKYELENSKIFQSKPNNIIDHKNDSSPNDKSPSNNLIPDEKWDDILNQISNSKNSKLKNKKN